MTIKKFSISFVICWITALQFAHANDCLSPFDDPLLCETKETQFESSDAISLKSKAEELGTPAKIYEYLRNNFEFVLYHGARSNSVNSFFSGRGNDVDLASTLIAMFRSQGIRSRYIQGNIRITREALSNWLGVMNDDLAVALLRDQGIQSIDESDPSYITFQHVWVEALVQYSNYRGANANNLSAACTQENEHCRWIAISPSFKQKKYKDAYRLLLRDLSFDYSAYYNALNPSSPDYISGLKNKNPLEIFEEKALTYLHDRHPGVTLDDVIDEGRIIKDTAGILPASLPFEVVGSVVRYNSIADHDLAEATDWTKYLSAKIELGGCTNNGILPFVNIPVVELSTKKLTVTLFEDSGSVIFGYRLDGQAVGTTLILNSGVNIVCGDVVQTIQAGSRVNVVLDIDVEPGQPPVSVTYNNLVVGGYYLIATGGETSNSTQIQRAYEDLLAASQQYTILNDESGLLGTVGTPYIDDGDGVLDSGDQRLADNLQAQDDLTGGLLYVAQSLYYTRLREASDRYSRLKGVISPISAYLGVVSTDDQVEYLDNVPFAITPGGLLIDLKGISLNGIWEIDQPETYSSDGFLFLGHIASSLEHEVWQEITGYDAISTVRGIQFAAEQGWTIQNLENNGTTNSFPDALTEMGFDVVAPPGFSRNDYADLFGRNLVAWSYSGSDPQAAFDVFRRDLNGLSPTDNSAVNYTYRASNGIDAFFKSYDATENQLQGGLASEGQLKTHIEFNSTDSFYATYDVLAATAANPSGFEIASFNRTGSDSYQFIIDETNQHADGNYPVTITLELADSNNTFIQNIHGLAGYTVIDVSATAPSGFIVNSFSQVNSDVWTVNFQQSTSHADGNYTVALKLTLVANSSIFTATINIGTRIVNNRFVDQTATFTTGGIDVSDNLAITCPGGANGEQITYTAAPSQLLLDLEHCFNNIIALDNIGDFVDFFDRNLGFDPASHAFRSQQIALNEYSSDFIRQLQAEMYFVTGDGYYQYRLPSHLPQDTFYLFSVYLKNQFNGNDELIKSTYAIVNHSNQLFGGGYVSAEQPIIQAVSEDFNNTVFTDTNVISVTNNDRIRTPSTIDPVSTVTGNMYHDETDIAIKGRGLDYLLTRTYNSNRAKQDGPLGFGWTHSYGMQLSSNDYGLNPNYDNSQALENDNGISSSITYTDERGGAHNFILNSDTSDTRSVASNPPGEFNTLQLNTPASGQHTLLFRSGVKYVFEDAGAVNLLDSPNNIARLKAIEDPYGNRLDMGYDGNGRLQTVSDNLGIVNRTGLIITYHGGSQRIHTISDWTGRIWTYLYNSQGDLDAMRNPLNQTMAYTYHADNHLLNQIIHPADRNGSKRTMAFSYYENGQAYAYSDQLNQTESLSYDLFRKTTRITNPRGFRTQHDYDENGGLIKLKEPDGAILQFKNNADGLRYSKTDGLGYETRYSYSQDRLPKSDPSDTFGLVTRELDALNQYTDFNYGIYDQLTVTGDKRGNSVTQSYYQDTDVSIGAVKGKLKEIRATVNGTADVLLRSFRYYSDIVNPAFGQVKQSVEYIEPNNVNRRRISEYVYESNGINLHSLTVTGASENNSITTTYSYDNLGRLTSQTQRRRTSADNVNLIDLTTTYEYDALGRVIKTTNPRGDIHETVYDENGKVVEEMVHYYTQTPREHCAVPAIHSDGRTYVTCTYATHRYDVADRLLETVDLLGYATTYQYDSAGNRIEVKNANGHVTKYEYDSMNRQTAVIDANGRRTEKQYDQGGRLIQMVDGNGRTTTLKYDPLGRLTETVSSEGRSRKLQYDANGNITHVLDANAVAYPLFPRNDQNVSVYREYDELNRVTLERDALNGETRYSYDLLGNITSITDAEDQVTRYVYDDLGRLIETIDPVQESSQDKTDKILQYDEAGNVLLTEDRSGKQRRMNYDSLNRLIRTDYLTGYGAANETIDDTDHYQYDDFGDLVQVRNNAVTYDYNYTSRHKLKSKTDSRLNKTLSWSYDSIGNIKTKTDYEGNVTNYQYDGTGRLTALQNQAFLQVGYHYDDSGRLIERILSNGAQSRYRYDDDSRLIELTSLSANGTVVENLHYQHDEIGNITQIVESLSGKIVSYSYDALYRLTTVDSSDDTEDRSYTYDKVGNRLTETKNGTVYYYCYHRTDCSQSPVGNRLFNIRAGGPDRAFYRQYEYDAAGRLWYMLDDTGSLTHFFEYNNKGRVAVLWRQEASGYVSSQYAYDPNGYRILKDSLLYHLEGEHLEAVYDKNGELKNNYFRGVVVDEVVSGFTYHSQNPGDWSNFTFHHDHLNSVTALTGHNGTVEEINRYDAFGASLNQTFPGSGNDLLFTGRELDRENGLIYYRARYYDPEIGRFTSEDPIGFSSGGVNFYTYCLNNPVNCNDPSGLIGKKFLEIIGKISENFGKLECKECADAMIRAAEQAGISGKRIDVRAPKAQNIFSDKNGLISTNGDHSAIEIDGLVFDNFTSKGVSRTDFEADLFTRNNDLQFNTTSFGPTTGFKQALSKSLGLMSVFGAAVLATVSDEAKAFINEPIDTAYSYTGFSDAVDITKSLLFGNLGDGTCASGGCGAANGGFVLYPNKTNTNMLKSVYSK